MIQIAGKAKESDVNTADAITSINNLLENYFEIFQTQEAEEKNLIEELETELRKKKDRNDLLDSKLNSIAKNVKMFVDSISAD